MAAITSVWGFPNRPVVMPNFQPATLSPNWPVAGGTTNFTFYFKSGLPNGQNICDTMRARCEYDYAALKTLFGVEPAGRPFNVFVSDGVDGAMHYGCADTQIYVGNNDKIAPSSYYYPYIMTAEVVEIFEAAIANGWNCGYNNGEALSRVLPADIYYPFEIADAVTACSWLDETTDGGAYRQDWIDKADSIDTNPFSLGCSVLFLNWLRFVKTRSWSDIINAGGITLSRTYQSLFGASDGWTQFNAFIDANYPPNTTSNVTTDNPFR